jgi:hypothetical protein
MDMEGEEAANVACRAGTVNGCAGNEAGRVQYTPRPPMMRTAGLVGSVVGSALASVALGSGAGVGVEAGGDTTASILGEAVSAMMGAGTMA